jgi:PKD repeat protein
VNECTGSICDFDGSPSSDNDGTIASYAWQFGDGTSGSGQTPHHAYAIGNRYVVTLTVTDDSGTTGAVSMTIDANAPPVAALAVTCSGPICTFDASGSADRDGTIASYTLSFGDGHSTGFSTGPTASHTYATGTFTATLYVHDNGGAVAVQTTSVSVTNVLPVATFTHACSTLTCAFNGSGSFDSDGDISYYFWTFGDGTSGSGSMSSHTYAAAGTYAVTLRVSTTPASRRWWAAL